MSLDALLQREDIPEEDKAAIRRLMGPTTTEMDVAYAEEAMREIKAQRDIIFETNPHVMLIFDFDTLQIHDVNPAAVKQYGYTREELLGMKVSQIRMNSDEAAFKAYLAENPKSNAGYLSFHRRKDGTTFPVEVTSATLKSNGHTTRWTMAQDISERLAKEAELRESEERYRSLFEQANDAIYISDTEGRILAANTAALELFGYSKEDLLSHHVTVLYQDPDERMHMAHAIEHAGMVRNFPLRLKRKDGTPLECELTSVARRDESGRITGYQGMIRDVTERNRLQDLYLEQETERILGHVAASVAHDLNNILMPISLSLEQEKRRQQLTDGTPSQHIMNAMKQLGRTRGVVNDMESLAGQGQYHVQDIDPNVIVKEVACTLQRLKSMSRQLEITRDCKARTLVHSDANQLFRVVMNVANNAYDAMPHGGMIGLRTEDVTLAADRDTPYGRIPAGAYVEISVSDTGIGIPEDILPRIFDPMFTTKRKVEDGTLGGTGVGLYAVKRIVKGADGHIDLETTVGKGTTMRIYLPAVEQQGKEAIIPRAHGKGGRLLLIDDDESIRSGLHALLECEGFEVTATESGKQGIEYLNQGCFDYVLTDLLLAPGDIAGVELVGRIRELAPDARTILMSGYFDQGAVQRMLKGGAHAFLPKPCDTDAILQALYD